VLLRACMPCHGMNDACVNESRDEITVYFKRKCMGFKDSEDNGDMFS
jgi:hypothetical protein